MKTKQTAYWLLSLLMLATATVLTACADDDDPKKDPDPVNPGEESVTLGEPIGLVYTDFLTENDVTHNADTTELTISKALADNKGITDFVNRPMGIWDKKEHRAYLRRATEQQLVGDRYVLKVVRSSVAEVTQGQELQINTGLYYNPTRRLSRGGLTRASGGDPEIDKYIDDDNIIHPAAITVQRKVDDGSNAMRSRLTRSDGDDGNSATFTIEELYTMPPSGANGWFDWLEDVWDAIVDATSYDWNDDKTISLIHTNTTLSSDIKFECGKESGDTVTLRFRCPMQFDLDYTLKINSHGSIETAFVPIPSYLETYIEGYFEANPQLRIGFSKAVSIPEDKQRITLFQFSGVGFTFMLGPVPLTIDIDPSVYLKFTSTLMGDAYFGVQYDIASRFKFGVKYDSSGWSGIADGEKVKDMFSFINPKLAFRYIGSAGIYFGVDIIIEKVAGPSLNIGPRVAVDAKLSYELGADHVDADIEAKAGIGGEAGAKIKIFGFNVLNWQNYFDIGPQWTIFKYPDDGSGSSGNYDPDNGGGGILTTDTLNLVRVTSDYEVQNGQTLTGTLGKDVKISIADGATVTLNNATINGRAYWNLYQWAGLNCLGDATILLVGENNIRGFHEMFPAIFVPEGKTLTIMGSGSLTASSNGSAAGIGGIRERGCGNIVIEGGNINATGGLGSAGIGSAGYGSCGNITLKGGTVSATGGNTAAGIGSGSGAECGNITITNGVTRVTANKGQYAPNSIGAGSNGTCGTITIGEKVTGEISTSPFTYTPGTSGSPAGTVYLSKVTSDVIAYNGDVLTGTLGKDVKISVADGATVTLDGATVNVTSYNASPWAGITCLGNATIVLKGANTVKGFSKNYPGIYVPKGKTLTIRGDGSLTATSNDYGAGIGGGYEMDCGNITIEGGTVNATGTAFSAGIGGGYQATCGNISITNGVTSVTATAGNKYASSIGAGYQGSCGKVTFGGIETGSITTSPYTYDPKAVITVTGVTLSRTMASIYRGETLTLKATVAPSNATFKNVTWSSSNTAVATVADGVVTAKGDGIATITVKTNDGAKTATCAVSVGVPVTGVLLSQTSATLNIGGTLTLKATVVPDNAADKSVTWSSSNAAVATVDDGVVTAKALGTATITVKTNDGAKTATCTINVVSAVDLSTLTSNHTVQNGDVLTGTLGANVKISVAAGATVTLDGVTINGTNNSRWAGINCVGDATIILKGENYVKGFYMEYPGIHIASGKTLTIKGDGKLTATNNGFSAAIGGGLHLACGNIVIEGGTITATSTTNGAGIGSGGEASCGNITIKGGTVEANGGTLGAGIGSGSSGSCGDITITDGVTKVTARRGDMGNSIGPGYQGSCGTITIGGQVTGKIWTSPYIYRP